MSADEIRLADGFRDDGTPAFLERPGDHIEIRSWRARPDDEGIGKFEAIHGCCEDRHKIRFAFLTDFYIVQSEERDCHLIFGAAQKCRISPP